MVDMYASSMNREDVFSLLSNQRRRYTVRAFQQLETPIELGELSEYVAAKECNKSISEVTSEERRRVYTSLQQNHINKLEDADVVVCDRNTIEPTERLEELESYLEVVHSSQVPWAQYYLALSGVAGTVVAAVWIGGYPETVLGSGWVLGVLMLFAVSAAVHYCKTKQHNRCFGADITKMGNDID